MYFMNSMFSMFKENPWKAFQKEQHLPHMFFFTLKYQN